MAAAPVAPALASSYSSGSGPASFGVGVPVANGGMGNAYAPPTAPAAPGGSYLGGTADQWANLSKAPQANPYQGYIDAFNASMDKSRAGIDRTLHQSLGELQGRRDAAAGVVAGLPSQVASAYNQASGGLQGNAAAATSALSPDVKGSANAIAAPLQSALGQDKAGAMASGPFLQLAMRANADSGQNALENSAYQANAGLDQQNAQFQQSMLMQQAQADAAARAQASQNQYATQQQSAQLAQQHAWAMDPSNPDSIAGRTALNTAQNTAAVNAQPSGEAPLAGTGLTNGEVTQLRASPEYQQFTHMITAAQQGNKNAANGVMIMNELATKNPKLLALLMRENKTFFDTSKLPTTPGTPWWAKNDLNNPDSPIAHAFSS